MLEVAGDDARVVRPVPGPRRRVIAELQPEPDCLRRRLARPARRAARPPRIRRAGGARSSPATRRCPAVTVERVEDTALGLPAHERQRRPPERQMTRRAARRAVEHPRHQCEARRRIVARAPDLRLSPCERVAISGLHTSHSRRLPDPRARHRPPCGPVSPVRHRHRDTRAPCALVRSPHAPILTTLLGLCSRQREGHAGTAGGAILGPNSPSVGFHEPSRDGQPETASGR